MTEHDGRDEPRYQGLDISSVITKIAKIPNEARSFDVPANRAIAEFRVDPELQDKLLAAGIPNIRRDGTLYFDGSDLLNISLHLDIGSRQRKILGWWARELERPYGESVTYRMDYVTGCPEPNHPGICTFSLLGPGSRRIKSTASDRRFRVRYSHTFTLRRKWPPLPSIVREIIDGTREIRFMQVPGVLRWDIDFIQREKVTDCGGIAQILVSEATSRGIPARLSYGVALTPPFASSHFWAEFLIDDIWVPVDPLFIDFLMQEGILNGDRWNRYESLGAILARMGASYSPSVLHNGERGDAALRVYNVMDSD